MTRLVARLRGLGRWITDWRTGATIAASILVALLAVVVIDNIQAARADRALADQAMSELEATVQELQRRGVRIDDLAAQLEETSASRERLAEEVRALRELLIDAGMLEPHPAGAAAETAPPGESSTAQQPKNTPAPRPSQQPRPTSQPPSPTPRPSPTPSPSPEPPPYCLVPVPVLCP